MFSNWKNVLVFIVAIIRFSYPIHLNYSSCPICMLCFSKAKASLNGKTERVHSYFLHINKDSPPIFQQHTNNHHNHHGHNQTTQQTEWQITTTPEMLTSMRTAHQRNVHMKGMTTDVTPSATDPPTTEADNPVRNI